MGAPPPVVPQPAASIMLIRDRLQDRHGPLQVLMIRRAETLAFAPGAFVFPGGKLERRDSDYGYWRQFCNSASPNHPTPLAQPRGRPAKAGDGSDFGYRIAGLRELYEEAGILLLEPHRQIACRRRCGKRGADIRLLARCRAGLLDTRSLVRFARWITPEGLPRRYDTHFFLAPLKGVARATADGWEATAVCWVSPRRLLADWEAGRVPLMFPTRLNLMKLAQAGTVRAALQQARRTPPLCVVPRITADGKGRRVVIPKSAGFGVTEATRREMMVERPVRS